MRKTTSVLLIIAITLSVLSALTFTANAEGEEGEFTAVQLSLGYNIGMTYYTNIDYASDVSAHVTINGRTDIVKAVNVSGMAAFSFDGIAPHELGADIIAEVYKGNAATGITEETTVAEVCALYLDNPFSEYVEETRDGIYKLVSNLLQYGEYARIYKDVPESILSDISSANYTPDILGTPEGTPTTVESNEDLSLKGLSVFFDTMNRYYVRFATSDVSKVNFTVGGVSYTEYGEKDGYYYFYTNPMTAKDTNNTISIKGYYESTTTINISYSIEQYIVDLEAASASEGMINLAKSIYEYSYSAHTYVYLDFDILPLPVLELSNITIIGEQDDFNNTYEVKSQIVNITSPETGKFTVTYDKACCVFVPHTVGNNTEYVRLYATHVDGNTYSFDVGDESSIYRLSGAVVIAIKGDATGDGIIDDTDAAQVKEASISRYEFNNLEYAAADVNGDERISAIDACRVKSTSIDKYVMPWDIASERDERVYSYFTVLGEIDGFCQDDVRDIFTVTSIRNGQFTATYDMGCVVIIKTVSVVDNNVVENYERLHCTAVEGAENTYAFDLSEYGYDFNSNIEILIAIKFDLDGDGVVEAEEADRLRAVSISNDTLNELEFMIADQDGNGRISATDAARARSVVGNTYIVSWDISA